MRLFFYLFIIFAALTTQASAETMYACYCKGSYGIPLTPCGNGGIGAPFGRFDERVRPQHLDLYVSKQIAENVKKFGKGFDFNTGWECGK